MRSINFLLIYFSTYLLSYLLTMFCKRFYSPAASLAMHSAALATAIPSVRALVCLSARHTLVVVPYPDE